MCALDFISPSSRLALFWFSCTCSVTLADSALAEPLVNDGVFSEHGRPEGCYAIRRTERSGFEKYYTGELVTDPAEKPGANPIRYSNGGVIVPREVAYADLVNNHIADIFCVGDVITVSSPMYSNGGNVFILANRIEMHAPIDTRIYFNIGNRQRYNRNDKDLEQPYGEILSSYHKNNIEAVLIGQATFAPEFPSGGSINYAHGDFNNPQNGSVPPSIPEADRVLAKSGSITIFSKTIEISESVRGGLPPSSDICSAAVNVKAFAFQAGGVRGGKGGMGSPPSCSRVNHSGGFSCRDELYVDTGINAPPGAGGDASNVSIMRIGADFTEVEKDLIKEATNVAGGPSGPSAKYRMIDAREVDSGISTNICDRSPVGQHTIASAGHDGALRTGSATVLQALEHAESFAMASDAHPSVDVRDLILRARISPAVQHRNMQEFLRSRLSRIALSAERMWAEQLANQVAGSKLSVHPSIEPFGTLRADLSRRTSPSLSNNIIGLASRLSALDISPSANSAASYFSNKGGAFSVTNPDATSAINGKIIGEDLAVLTEATVDQLLSLNRIELAVNESLYASHKDSILQKIAMIQQKIGEINSIAQTAGADFDDILSSIQRATPAISEFVSAVLSQKYIEAGKASSKAMAGIKDIIETVFGEVSSGEPKPIVDELKVALDDLMEGVKKLDEIYGREKNNLLETQFYFAANELAARHRLSSRIDGRLPLGEDLIKHAFVAYYIDPARNKDYLIENLLEAALFLGGRVEYYAMLRLPPIQNPCQLGSGGEKNYSPCIILPASSQYRVVEVNLGGIKFPVWVVAPNVADMVWPTFNAKVSVTKRRTRDEVLRSAVQ